MERGFITLELKGHKEPKALQYKQRRFNDNEWHRLSLVKKEREIRLQVGHYSSAWKTSRSTTSLPPS